MNLNLAGKTVVITGGTAGIGKAAALAFAKEGCNVAVCARSTDKIKELIEEYKNQYEIFAGAYDVSSYSEMEQFSQEVIKKFGAIDVWINNAAICPQRDLLAMTEEEWGQIFNINIKSIIWGAKVASQYMRKTGGVILNAASYASLIPSAGTGAYAATKAATLSLTKTLAAELAPFNIRVNAYIPGVIITEMTKGAREQKEQGLLSHITLNRFGEPEEVAEGIVFLASDAAKYMTGTYLEISGGKLCVQNPLYGWSK